MDNIRQLSFTPRPTNITSDLSNAFGLTPDPTLLIEALLAQIPLVQVLLSPVHPIQVSMAQILSI